MLISPLNSFGSNVSRRVRDWCRLTSKPMVAVLGEPEPGLLDAWRAMRVFCLSKRGMNPKARNCAERKGDEETG